MIIQESAENYLETILMLSREQEIVRAIDIVNKMGFSKPSVSVAMKNFREEGYIEITESGAITLLPKGLAIAESTYGRHNAIAKMLMCVGVDEETALTDACKIEHDISDKSFECLKAHFIKLYNK